MNPALEQRGSALLEVLCALMILSVVGIAAVQGVRTAIATIIAAANAEREAEAAGRVLGALTLFTRNDLDQRLGRRTVGEFLVSIQRAEENLYRIGVAPARTPSRELLMTVVYRQPRDAR